MKRRCIGHAHLPLLPHKRLIQFLCRRCYGESIEDLAEAYGLKNGQVVGLIRYHGKIYKNMKAFLGRSPPKCETNPKMEAGMMRKKRDVPKPYQKKTAPILNKCLKCGDKFYTDSPYWRRCRKCHESVDATSGCDFTVRAWLGAR